MMGVIAQHAAELVVTIISKLRPSPDLCSLALSNLPG